ncbi:hypothetical protein HKX48_003136 [Thoreauomyces humboldtii]|nr:hypothetical protein HKX48_003136 [Thoreauomyces humboldtii]
MTLTSQASFPSEFGQLCSHILDIKGTCRTLSLRRQPPRQFKKHLSAFYGHLLQDGGDSADAGSHAATRSDDWTSLLSERVAAKLYDLRVDRRFDDCNALSALLEALGVDCGAGIPGDLGRDVVEIERDGVTDVVAWEHPRSILWLLFSLAGPLDAERKAADSARWVIGNL